jgi:hypothetical protein
MQLVNVLLSLAHHAHMGDRRWVGGMGMQMSLVYFQRHPLGQYRDFIDLLLLQNCR